MGDCGKRDIDILREKLGNGLSPFTPKPAIVPKDHSGNENENVRMAEAGVLSISEKSPDLNLPLDEDSGSEYGDVVVPMKRKRRTNNSFALDLDDSSSEIAVPTPPKRLQFSPNAKDGSVLIGVWKDSPPSDPAKKHAIYAFLDVGDRVRRKIYPETRNGEALHEGYPSGTGRAFVTPELVILDPQLSFLSRQELKEYIRLRVSHRQNESPEERKEAEALAVQEAKKIANKNTTLQTPRPAPSTPATSTKPAKTSTPNTPKGGLPNGIFLGFWKDSDAVQDIDKHAAFGVVDGNRLRVKVIKFTRDGRPYQGNFPTNPGSNWIPFDDVVREPPLAKMLRCEMIEYVRIRQNDKLQGRTDFDPFGVDIDAMKKAIEIFGVIAKAQGVTAAKLDAHNESSRKAHNESRAALKAKDVVLTKGWKYESSYAQSTLDNSRTQDAKDGEVELARGRRAEIHMARRNEQSAMARETEADRGKENSSIANLSRNDYPVPKTTASEALASASKADTQDGKAKAIRSKKAEADATAEKLKRVREAAAKAKESAKGNESAKQVAFNEEVRSRRDREGASEGYMETMARTGQELARQAKETHQAMSKREDERARIMEQANGHSAQKDKEIAKQGVMAKQGDSMTPRQRAIKEAEAKEKETRNQEANDREAREREAKEKAAKEREVKERGAKEREAKDREAAQRRAEMEKAKADAIKTSSSEFFNNTDASGERAKAVSEESRKVANPLDPVAPFTRSRPSSDVKIHNSIKYVRQERGPFAGKLVGEKNEFLTIDGENYVECRILMRAEF